MNNKATLSRRQYATVAQQVEQFTRNEQVASSNLASSSNEKCRILSKDKMRYFYVIRKNIRNL